MSGKPDPFNPLPTRREVLIQGVVTSLALAGFHPRSGIALANIPGVTRGKKPVVEEGPFRVDASSNGSTPGPTRRPTRWSPACRSTWA